MVTTVSVGERTKRKLEKLKEAKGAASFDELLGRMADTELKIPDSLFGRVKGIRGNFEREHEDRV